MFASVLFAALSTAGIYPAPTGAEPNCAREVNAIAFADRIAKLPESIRTDLDERVGATSKLGDRGAPLLRTDAPGQPQSEEVPVRFVQPLQIGDQWFVQIEVAMMSGVTTIGYSLPPDGLFTFEPGQVFRGPPCASIMAALAGVTVARGL